MPTLRNSYWAPTEDEPVAESTVASILRDAARSAPQRTALVRGAQDPEGRDRYSYSQLLGCAERTAGLLAEQFARNERVCCYAPSVPEALVVTYATALAGLVLVPANPALRSGELTYVLAQCGASGIVTGAGFRGGDLRDTAKRAASDAPSVREILRLGELVDWDTSHAKGPGTPMQDTAAAQERPMETRPAGREPEPDDVAQLVYTSGTTGLAKGARLTHKGMTNAARFGAIRFGLRPGDVYLDTMPLHHVGGQVVAFQICQQLATAVLVSGFDAGLVLELLESERATVTVGVPTMLVSLIEHPDFEKRDLSALRSVSSGGSVVPPDLVRHIESTLGVRSTICFGQTETCGFISQTHLSDSAEDKATTLGQPLARVEARVVASAGATPGAEPDAGGHPEDTVVDCGVVGELQVRSPYVMQGYHLMPEATADAFAPGGWLRTGDLVTMDERGFLRIAGRVKDMIVTGGENVFPAEVEAVLCEHPDVAMAAVVGISDRRWGEQVVAVVRLAPGASFDPVKLTAYMKERLASFKVPKRIVSSDEMPLTASGKIQKFVLRE
ncbi:MAG TPA: class I adenylate-forming enzyme family protein, partial [Acidimicrobiales bacterium]|nr:class I adenylate-forming enzyme family protein [Acidimicrobiales bacterium]